jgi:DNA-binding response OmpR family regulator
VSDTRPLVLIVDDEPEILDVLREHLDTAYRTRTALDGEAALTALGAERPDVILLDLNMPVMDGIETQRRIRATDATIPVIVLTAVQDVARLSIALENGAFGYLPKPYDILYLEHLVAAAVQRQA